MFTKGFGQYVFEGDSISCDVDGFNVMAFVYRDNDSGPPDKQCDGFWPSHNPKDAGYVLPEDFEREQAIAEECMRAWNADEWFYCGVCVVVFKNGIQLTGTYDNALWGVECNYPGSDNSYLTVVANDYLPQAIEQAKKKLAELVAC